MAEDEKSCIRCRYTQLRLGGDGHVITWECRKKGRKVVYQVRGSTGKGSPDREVIVNEPVCGQFKMGEYFRRWLKERPLMVAKAAGK